MKYRTLGKTGINVSTLCLGTMMFGAWGNPDVDECTRIVDAALDAGINFVDTADVYDFGRSEEIVGQALKGRRDNVILATKVNNAMDADPNHRGNSRRWIMHEVEASLRRLQTDWIDLYQIHRPDPSVDIDETLGALSDLIHAGKVRAIGSSTFPAEDLVHAAWTAERSRREPFRTEQPPYSIFTREIESHVLPVLATLDMTAIVWAPLNGGWLSGKYRRGMELSSGDRAVRQADHFDWNTPAAEQKLDLVASLIVLADQLGCPLAHLAVAFVLAHPAVTSAIVGPRTLDHMTSILGAEDVTLSEAVLDSIDELIPPGSNINATNAGYVPPALEDAALRRRS